MPQLGAARLPEGLRVYAIGDVHGDIDALERVRAWIDRDLYRRPAPSHAILALGDLIDRGPDSAGVLRLVAQMEAEEGWVCLLGNHDDFLRRFMADPEDPSLADWIENGGDACLASWGIAGVTLDLLADGAARQALRTTLLGAMGEAEKGLVARLRHMVRFGEFAFVHAGIRPGVALSAQAAEDMLWIRGTFLRSKADHGAVVVHGHTPADKIEIRPNRIGVDTGCGKGGRLSCIAIEGAGVAELTADGPAPLP